ncbi:hypothetical protein [Clostridioides difficile]|uniref:hypothetical protein n=1 Tax=Clostridioides difficile TaxID=1496 RepID=UPI003557A0C3
MKNNTSDSRVKYFCKCPYCGFDNEVEVKKGLKPKICCICTKEKSECSITIHRHKRLSTRINAKR